MQRNYSQNGIPQKCMSDNGPQYLLVSYEFVNITHDWNFQRMTSSPKYPTSNGLAIQIIKQILVKLKK